MRPRIWFETCAGSAAVALRLVGGPNANPPIGYQGSKRGYARAILAALGLRQGLGAGEVWLSDPGPWGSCWAVLTQPGMAEAVAGVIRSWEGEEPRALWERLRAQGWGEMETAEEVGAWTWCHARSKWSLPVSETSGVLDEPSGDTSHPLNGHRTVTDEAIASRVEAVARWLAIQGGAYGGYDVTVKPPTPDHNRRPGGVHPGTWPNDITDRLSSLPVPVPVRVRHGSALDVPIPDDCTDCVVYADPSYKHPNGTPTTGYRENIYAEDLRPYLLEWSRRGATVAISDARPNADLMGEGWVSFRIDSERVGQKRTFSAQQTEWLTMNREPAWRPSVQQGLFG